MNLSSKHLSNSFAYAAPGMIREKDIAPIKEVVTKDSTYIQLAIQSHFRKDTHQLKRKIRKREIVFPRQIAMFLHVRNTTMTKVEIAKMYGGMDHTVVIHSEKKIISYLEQKHTSLEKQEILDFFNKYGFEQ